MDESSSTIASRTSEASGSILSELPKSRLLRNEQPDYGSSFLLACRLSKIDVDYETLGGAALVNRANTDLTQSTFPSTASAR
jgi:hypothetical protein